MLKYELQDEGKARTCKISPCRQEQQSTPTKTSSNESVNSASVVIDVTPKQERHRNRISARLPPREELFMETKYTTSSATALPFYYNLRLAVANEMPMSSFHRHIPICPALTVAERQAKIAAHTNLLHQEIQASDKRFHDLLARISELDKKTCDRRKAMQEKRRCCISCLNNSSHQIIPSPKENP